MWIGVCLQELQHSHMSSTNSRILLSISWSMSLMKTRNSRMEPCVYITKVEKIWSKIGKTFNVQHDDFALDRAGVDRTAVLSLIFWLDVSYLQVPLLVVRPYDHKPCIVNHSSFFVSQWDWAVVKPGHLYMSTTQGNILTSNGHKRHLLNVSRYY